MRRRGCAASSATARAASLPFAEDRAAREAAGDPRRSLRERYGSRARYAAEVREAADALARDRLMLPEDAAAFAAAAAAARPAGLPD